MNAFNEVPFRVTLPLFPFKDALEVLMSKDIKINNARFGKETEEGDADECANEEKEKAMAAAKGKLLSKASSHFFAIAYFRTVIILFFAQIVKKNVIENIVPIIIHLKHLLEEKHSPLLGPLMQYLTDLMKDYKSEISGFVLHSYSVFSFLTACLIICCSEIMIADKQLAKELDYDLRQFNIEKSRKKRMSLVGLSPAVARQGTPSVARLPMAASPSR